jgi:hypothetical protein
MAQPYQKMIGYDCALLQFIIVCFCSRKRRGARFDIEQ